MLQLVRMTVLPLGVGMIVRRFVPDAAARMSRWLRPVSMIVLVGVIAFAVGVSLDMVLSNIVSAGPAIWTLNIVAMGAGLVLARMIGAGTRDAMTLSIEDRKS